MDVGWAFTDGILFTFPIGAYVPADGYALVVQTDPAAFRTEHGIPESVNIYGPFEAPPEAPGIPTALANDGERLALSRPGEPEIANPPPGQTKPYVPYIEIEKITYEDSPPWDVRADGGGFTLARIDPDAYIDDVVNWPPSTSGGTPGAANTDFDFTPPTVPSNVYAIVLDPDEIRIAWSASTDPESGVRHYVVYRNGVPINQTSDTFLVDGSVAPSVPYAYQISAVNVDYFESALSTPAVEARILSADVVATPGGTSVSVRFSEAVDQASAENASGYTITYDGGASELDVLDADLQPDTVTVLLTLDGSLAPTVPYRLTVRGVQAAVDGTPVAPNCYITFQRYEGGSGTILRQWWTNIPGTAVSDLTGHIDYPANPDGQDEVNLFEIPTNWGTHYGTRVRGYVHPFVTGEYTFWIASDDNSELWLNVSGEDPAGATLIASVPSCTASQEWDKFPEQQSVEIYLEVGSRYYIEAIQKEGSGDDNLAVAWTLPGENPDDNGPIPGDYLSPFVQEPLPLVGISATDDQADEQDAADTGTFTIERDAADPDPLTVHYLVSGADDADYEEVLSGHVIIPADETS
ncbi:MAG: PA14 domain-containing protein, partial [Planctomycetota bacterium]|nr:PA14 domain-containing protein [Planctomycetota bacterium]